MAVAKRATATVNKHLAVYATEEVALVPEPFDARLGFDLAAASRRHSRSMRQMSMADLSLRPHW